MRFGRLEYGLSRNHVPSLNKLGRITNVDADGNLLPIDNMRRKFNIGNSAWHSDSSYKRVGAKASTLAAHVVPDHGGETEWADLRFAYDQLDSGTQEWLQDRVAVHDYGFSHAWHQGRALLNPDDYDRLVPVRHRLVKTHPDSKRKLLFVGRHASHIVGEDFYSSRKLLRKLTQQAANPDHVWRHSWKPGDIVIWDNRCVVHRARRYSEHAKRAMARSTVAGDDPTNEWAYTPSETI